MAKTINTGGCKCYEDVLILIIIGLKLEILWTTSGKHSMGPSKVEGQIRNAGIKLNP